MELIDIGVNLTNSRLIHNRDALKQNALAAGVSHQIITGTCIETSIQAAEISRNDPGYYSSTAGCHPHDAKDFLPEHIEQLKSLALQTEVVAIGECGLDFNRNFSPQEQQISVFEQLIELAIETGLPLFLHQRDAHDTFISLLKPYAGKVKGVCHCFTGDVNEQKDYLDLGFYIGITGWICDERRGQSLQEAGRYTPDDRILLETDAPYLLPRTIRPRPKKNLNVPAYLPWVLDFLADLRGVNASTLAKQTIQNTKTLFNFSR